MKPGPGGAPTLPHWLQMFFLAVAEAPWTNLKTFNALTMTNGFLIFLGVASVFGWKVDESVLNAVLIFLGSWLGIAMVGSIGKRATYKPSPPYGPDIEDAQAGATATPEDTKKNAVAERLAPTAGVKPSDPDIREVMESVAKRQKSLVPPDEDEGLA